jgi:hypothetical protein
MFGPLITIPADKPLPTLVAVVTAVLPTVVAQPGMTTLAGSARIGTPVPAPVEATLLVTVMLCVMEVMLAPGERLALFTTTCPSDREVLRVLVIVVMLLTVTPAVKVAEVSPSLVRLTPVADPVARTFRLNVVASGMETTVAPVGMFGP